MLYNGGVLEILISEFKKKEETGHKIMNKWIHISPKKIYLCNQSMQNKSR